LNTKHFDDDGIPPPRERTETQENLLRFFICHVCAFQRFYSNNVFILKRCWNSSDVLKISTRSLLAVRNHAKISYGTECLAFVEKLTDGQLVRLVLTRDICCFFERQSVVMGVVTWWYWPNADNAVPLQIARC